MAGHLSDDTERGHYIGTVEVCQDRALQVGRVVLGKWSSNGRLLREHWGTDCTVVVKVF